MFLKTLDVKNAYMGILEKQHAKELYHVTVLNRDHLRQWLPWVDATCTLAQSRGFITSGLQQFALGNGFQAGIWYSGILAGVIGLHNVDYQNKKTSIGYWLAKDHQGKGLITSATCACLNYVFEDLKLNRVEIKCATENTKSRAIPLRLGFVEEGIIRQAEWINDHYVDHMIYGMLASEWGGRKGSC